MQELIRSPMFLAPFLAWIAAQLIKTLIFALKYKRFDFRGLLKTGGMPSSHSSGTVALTTAVGRIEGWTSPIFIVTLVFTFIIMNDAAGVRRSAGQQARVLNKMLEDGRVDAERVKEFLGHTPIEVMVGGVLGAIIGVLVT
ncbi:MAG: divergent PAP2 family protein [Candidatus Desantisbacteria bacterium]